MKTVKEKSSLSFPLEFDQVVKKVETAVKAIRSGGIVIMTDDEDRENEGDLVFAAEDVTPQKINFLAHKARGLICLALDESIVNKLELPMMEDPSKDSASLGTAFTVSIEAKKGVSTGISAHDRAHTIKTAIDPRSSSEDLVVPGHIFPLKAQNGGVLKRVGHTEGSVDLVKLAGKLPAAVICEVMNEDGSMARLSNLEIFAKEHQVPIVSIADLITYRLFKDQQLRKTDSSIIKTDYGEFIATWFEDTLENRCHFSLQNQQVFQKEQIVDVRVQRSQGIMDIFSAKDLVDGITTRGKIEYALKMLKESKQAAFVYLDSSPLETASLSKKKSDDEHTDFRNYGIGAQILKSLGVKKMRLHLRNKISLKAISGFDLDIIETQTF